MQLTFHQGFFGLSAPFDFLLEFYVGFALTHFGELILMF